MFGCISSGLTIGRRRGYVFIVQLQAQPAPFEIVFATQADTQAPIFQQILQLPTLPRMNALTGAGSIFALFGNYYDHHEWTDAPQADAVAILYDWVQTGNDIRTAIGQFKKETKVEQLELF